MKINCIFRVYTVETLLKPLDIPLGIHRNVDICQTDYSIPSKLELSPYSEVIHGNTTKLVFAIK